MIQLNYREAKPIYEQVRDGIRRLVLIGAILPGEAVTPVPELSSRLAISPNAVGRAYRELEAEGYLKTGMDGAVIVAAVDRRRSCRAELLERFDDVVLKLLALGMTEGELQEYLFGLVNGGQNDTGKPCD